MKTQRALILPVLLVALVVDRSELRAQAQPAPAAAPVVQPGAVLAPYTTPPSAHQVPLGIPSTLNAPEGASGGAAWGGGYVMPTGYMYGPPPMAGAGGSPTSDMNGAMMNGPMMNGPMMNGPMMNGPVMDGSAPMGPGYEMGAYGGQYGGEVYGGDMYGGAFADPYCDPYGGGERGFDLLQWLLPYGAGGWCSPRWYDIYAEFMYLEREDVSRRVDLISEGPAGFGAPFIVLSTDDLDFDKRPGFRFVGAVQVGASSALEVNYFGTFNWAESASVTSDFDELFSAFSDFGTNPPPQAGPPIVLPGFSDTDNAEFASIEYSSTFDSIELDFRRRWMAPNCRFQGSCLAGVRYFRLEESFVHKIRVNLPDPNLNAPNITGFLDYSVETANSMTGFQVGGDAWITLFPGIQVGSEGKIGIYGNRADQHTVILAQSLTSPIDEVDTDDDVAFLGEAALISTWRVNQNLTLRTGLQFLFVEGVALAPENFNPNPPFIAGERQVFINDNGDVFYHGFTAGVEWMW